MESNSIPEVGYKTFAPTPIIVYFIYGVNIYFLFCFIKSLSVVPNSMNDDVKSNTEMIVDYLQSKGLWLTELWNNFVSHCGLVRSKLSISYRIVYSAASKILRTLVEIALISLKELAGLTLHFILLFIGRNEEIGAMKSVAKSLPNHSKVSSSCSLSNNISQPSCSRKTYSSPLEECGEAESAPTSINVNATAASPDTVASVILNESYVAEKYIPLNLPSIVHLPKSKHMFSFGFHNRKKSYNSDDTESVTTRGSFRLGVDATPQSIDDSVVSRSSANGLMASPISDSQETPTRSYLRHRTTAKRTIQQSHNQSNCTPVGVCSMM